MEENESSVLGIEFNFRHGTFKQRYPELDYIQLKKTRQQDRNGVTYAKPTSPNWKILKLNK